MVGTVNRTVFLVDGFNLYHSLRTASVDLGGASTKWLDLPGLLESYLHVIGDGASVHQVFYFSALTFHLETRQPGVTSRHRNYIECLQDSGVALVLERCKPKYVDCGRCRQQSEHFEEKETDVAISVKLVEFVHEEILLAGYMARVRAAKMLFPRKTSLVHFPIQAKEQRASPARRRVLLHQEGAVPSASVAAGGHTLNRPPCLQTRVMVG